MVNLITTDSYFNIFSILVNLIEELEKDKEIKTYGHNLVFSEEKVSLMIERMLCHKMGGSFNTDVYSFGNYLRAKRPSGKVLSKEGSSMAVQRILTSLPLKLFKSGKSGLAPTLYDLIIQLKSAKVTPEDILSASKNTEGLLKSKLTDIYNVYDSYEKFIKEKGFDDQSSVLSYLDDLLMDSYEVSHSNIFVVGFSGFTAQLRSAVSRLMDKGLTFTAILTSGENDMAFVNETSDAIKKIAGEKNIVVNEKFLPSEYSLSGNIIKSCLFNTMAIKDYLQSSSGLLKEDKSNVYFSAEKNISEEIKSVGEIIKREVMEGNCRYRDITIAVPDGATYGDYIKDCFYTLDIPYFLDEKKKPDNHPLITLILSYIEMFRKGFDSKSVADFFKNPIFSSDKTLNDSFENYIIKYNISRNRFLEPFTLFDYTENPEELNSFREKLASYFTDFSVRDMLEKIDAENKIEEFSEKLESLNRLEDKAVNDQIYSAVINILDEMDALLYGVKLNLVDYKATFLSGISALKLSIIPQYNDAVFVGNYKEVALYKAKYLFAVGLTSDVPDVKKDVALLSDNDIDILSDIKVMVEPKINIINHRTRENVALALSAFTDRLYLSYPVFASDGSKNSESEIIDEIGMFVKFNSFPLRNGYLTYNESIKSFAKECGEFICCETDDMLKASSFYTALSHGDKRKKLQADNILKNSNREIKIKLENTKGIMVDKETSPTLIEKYYTCPYMVFGEKILNIKDRDEGGMKHNTIGTFMHEVFRSFSLKIDYKKDFDVESNFEEAFNEVLNKEEFKKYLFNDTTKYNMYILKDQCRTYCNRIYYSFINSRFKVAETEARIGDGKDKSGNKNTYPALPLEYGDFKINGFIDRVDESDKYYRIIDYKTGQTDVSDTSVFNGTKLQLYLYSSAVDKTMKGKGKKLAGCYYLPSWDAYESHKKYHSYAVGNTLKEKEAIESQGGNFDNLDSGKFLPVTLYKNGNMGNTEPEEVFNDYMKYAVKISSKAVERILQGVIVPSPVDKSICDYCKFKSFCMYDDAIKRKFKAVNSKTICSAVKGEEENE